ncbi:hypothetical protein [Secundilactobacillus kimchicus]|uniref:hypothetical protein n=1 Tax=Secundilactobacillus kimchicus TaxID=528209 RepID=UPI0024A8538E|nr:hypothetical protein [Secundilactobacillus kimchicus]
MPLKIIKDPAYEYKEKASTNSSRRRRRSWKSASEVAEAIGRSKSWVSQNIRSDNPMPVHPNYAEDSRKGIRRWFDLDEVNAWVLRGGKNK